MTAPGADPSDHDCDRAPLRVIALEEHFWTAEIRDALSAVDDAALRHALHFPAIDERLCDLGEQRLERMNEAGVDVQVLSVTTPGTQMLAAAEAVPLARHANDVAAEACRRHPERFAALATLPTPDPAAAAGELERAVTELGMVGALVFPHTGDTTLDDASLRPVMAIAAALGVPLYIHPQFPPLAIQRLAYSGFAPRVNETLASGGWGWHAEAGLSALRLILAGTFDRHPDLRIILGHWGEMLVGFMDRADALTVSAGLQRSVAEVISSNVLVTAGGIYSGRMLQSTLTMLGGADHVLMATDDPYQRHVADGAARAFLRSADLSSADREKIAHLNAERLGLSPRPPDRGRDNRLERDA